MTSFVIGKVLEPECSTFNTKDGAKSRVNFGLLSGKASVLFDVWQDDSSFQKASSLRDGDVIIVIVATVVGKDGKLRYYFRNCAPAPDGLRDDLMSLFN